MKGLQKSFRLRLAVLTALLASMALLGFAGAAWRQMYLAKVAAWDRQILDQAERELSKHWPPDHWPRHEYNMNRAFGAKALRQTVLLVQDRAGEVFRSAHWPGGLTPETLPWPSGNPVRDDRNPADNFRRTGGMQQLDRPPPPAPDRPELGSPPTGEEMDGITESDRPPPPLAMAWVNQRAGQREWRLGLATAPNGDKLAIGVDLALIEEEMADLRGAFLVAAPLALGWIGLGAWLLSGRILRPIRQLTATMQTITAKGLSQRIEPEGRDREFRHLILVFNGMLERLERGFLQASRFSADAAHELKTPLAILQGQIEQAIGQCEAGSPAQTRFAEILDEVQRLATISRKLLLLSLADAGRLRLNITRFDLSEALQDLLEDAQMLAPALAISGVIAPGLAVKADETLLRQVLHNLLSNAIKYNRPDGWIQIHAACNGRQVEIAISNSSPGIPKADRERIFERFYRAESSHNRQVDGIGLGLSLALEIVKAHGGDMALADSPPGEVRFVVSWSA